MTERVRAALDAIASMKAPSIAQILRFRGFRYEADQMDELVAAWNEYVSGLPPRSNG